MTKTVLVVTTVHHPDDTRIRERLIRTLSDDFEVRYATKTPGPSDSSGVQWLPLRGGRIKRNLTALWLALRQRWHVLVVHDPELLPSALLARLLKRRPVVFDVHENFPATAHTRGWVPRLLRKPLAATMRGVLRMAEMTLTLTLAEDGYRSLFRGEHLVIPNYPDTTGYPDPAPGDGTIVYLGDVTEERGAEVAAHAALEAGIPIEFVGRADDELVERVLAIPGAEDMVTFAGWLPNPEALAHIRGRGVAISPLLDLPNYRDSTPTKILEYLALGLPVVASDLPGTRRLVENLTGVTLVPPGDHVALSQAIVAALAGDRRDEVAAAVAEVRHRFSWPSVAVKEFYSRLV